MSLSEVPSGIADYTVGEVMTLLPSYDKVFFRNSNSEPLIDRTKSNPLGQALFRAGTALSALVGGAGFAPVAMAQELPVPGCEFIGGFKEIHDQIPDIIGDCINNEYHNSTNNDGFQDTISGGRRGHLFWNSGENTTSFTDGTNTWFLDQEGNISISNPEPETIEQNVAPVAVTPTPRPESPAPRIELTREQKISYVNNLELRGFNGPQQALVRQAIQEAIQRAPRNVDTNYRNNYLARTYSNIPYNAILDELNSMDMVDILSGVDFITAAPQSGARSASWNASFSNGRNGRIELDPSKLTLPGWSAEANRVLRVGNIIKEAMGLQIFASAFNRGVNANIAQFAENASMRVLWNYFVANTGNLSPAERGAILSHYERVSQDPSCC
jgi:hypothetical protein